MLPGTPDLILLIFFFVALQAWWLIPLIKKNNKLSEIDKELKKEIKLLEKLYRK